MKETTRKNEIPKPLRKLILNSPGASLEIARKAHCAKSLVSMVLSGKRGCSDRVYNAIVEWLGEPNMRALRQLAKKELRAR